VANLTVTDAAGSELRISPDATTGVYTSTVATSDFPFNAIAPHWHAEVPQGAGLQVELRVQAANDGWSHWYPVDDVHWVASKERFYSEAPLLLSNGRQFQYRVTMTASSSGNLDDVDSNHRRAKSPTLHDITLVYIDTTAGPTTSQAKAMTTAGQSSLQGVPQPAIIPRAGWGADESYRYDDDGDLIWPLAYRDVAKIVVHHTVTSNDYDQDQAAGWVRAIYYYHAVTRRWGDIGYNYLVDRFGNTYEGRYGGPGVVGGHVYDYNYGSMGVSVIGTHGNYSDSTPPAQESLISLADLSAWEASRSHVHPLESSAFWGATVPNLAGHRDYPPQSTSCPGDRLYAELPALRRSVWDRIVNSTPAYGVDWLTWQDLPAVVRADETVSASIHVRNTGWLTWTHVGPVNHVRLGYHWLDSDGRAIAQPPEDDHRTPLAHAITFGHPYRFEPALVTTPITPGIYTLAWDMVREGVTWFHDANANSPLLTQTITNAAQFITGRLLDVFGRPVSDGQVTMPSWITVDSDGTGAYTMPLLQPGTYTVAASAEGYAPLLPACHIDATQGDVTYPFVLVPDDFGDLIANGEFETGLDSWTMGSITASLPTSSTASHTGVGAAQLGGDFPTGTTWLSQSVMLPLSPLSPTLSLLYYVPATDGRAIFRVALSTRSTSASDREPLTYTLPITITGWTHFRADLPPDRGSGLDLRLDLVQGNSLTPTVVLVDEVRLGQSGFNVYLPLMFKLKEQN